MKSKLGVYLYDIGRKQPIYSRNKDIQFESSSTIKVPLLYFAFLKIIEEDIAASTRFRVEKRHLSNGSGVLNWSKKRILTLKEILQYTNQYSDCVATNMLIDFLGGKRKINRMLKARGFKTRLIIPLLNFPVLERVMPTVGITTPKEMLQLFLLLVDNNWTEEIASLINATFADTKVSFFKVYLPEKFKVGLLHKTGSMINQGKEGDTVCNVVGSLNYHGTQVGFSLCSRIKFGKRVDDEEIDAYKKSVVKKIIKLIVKYH